MKLRKHWTILSNMWNDTYLSSHIYISIGNYNSSDLSARLNDMYHMWLVWMAKHKGKNLYWKTILWTSIKKENDIAQYLPLLQAYKRTLATQKKLRSSQEESNVKRQNKMINTLVEHTPPVKRYTFIQRLKFLFTNKLEW